MEGPVLTSDACVFLTLYFIGCEANELVTCSSFRVCLSLRRLPAITIARLNNANKWRVYLRLGQALSNDNHNQMLKAPPDLLTFLKLIFGDTNSSRAVYMHVLS